MAKIELLCISDLHLGEAYTFLDYQSQWNQDNLKGLKRFRAGIAGLAGIAPPEEAEVEVGTLVLLGDIFELATATIERASGAGRTFFGWLFTWLRPEKVVYVPGNHDHVFWMWWNIPPTAQGTNWWDMEPSQAADPLKRAYGNLIPKTSPPDNPSPVDGLNHRQALIHSFFSTSADADRFLVGYPAYAGPSCGLPGSGERPYKTLFAHGHLNDPDYVDPENAGLRAWLMVAATGNWPRPANADTLDTLEETTWKYTTSYWYPPETDFTLGEALYLAYVKIEDNHPCIHPDTPTGIEVIEPIPELVKDMGSLRYFSDFIRASMEKTDPGSSKTLVYGHTHNGGAGPIENTLRLCNTGGWLDAVKDDPPHTHLFAIDEGGAARMIRVGFVL